MASFGSGVALGHGVDRCAHVRWDIGYFYSLLIDSWSLSEVCPPLEIRPRLA